MGHVQAGRHGRGGPGPWTPAFAPQAGGHQVWEPEFSLPPLPCRNSCGQLASTRNQFKELLFSILSIHVLACGVCVCDLVLCLPLWVLLSVYVYYTHNIIRKTSCVKRVHDKCGL